MLQTRKQHKSLTHEPPPGYWHKPLLSKLLAVGYLMFPAFTWMQTRASSGMEGSIWSSGVFLQELFCAVSAAVALLWVTKPSLFYLVGLSVYFIGYKIYQFSNYTLDTPAEMAATMFWFAAPVAILATRTRLAYLEPGRRWWKRPERYLHPTGAQALVRGVKFPLVVMNLSIGGAFVKLDERIFQEGAPDGGEKRHDGAGRFPSVNSTERFIAVRNMHEYPKLGDMISVAIETHAGLDSPFPSNRFTTLAEVVWVTKVTDPYRYGLGLRFAKVSFFQQRRLKRYLKLLPSGTN